MLDRPQEWSTKALGELRQKLSITNERFTIQNLQKAHQVRYHKALVDIISMVKHAARAEAPLLTAEERVNAAFEKVAAGKQFTDEQRQWLDRIRAHLIENLSLEQEDFEDLPVFARFGGWGRANRVFDNQLPDIIRQINEAIAA